MMIRTAASLGVLLWAAAIAPADILRVNLTANPGGDGSSWGRAFDSLTDALAAASSGDQVWVAGGTYVPELPAGRFATFTIPNGVSVYGGFQGNESNLAQRGDPFVPSTTLSGRLAAGSASYHVVSFSGAGASTRLDGFFIEDGFADGAGPEGYGGGIHAQNSSPVLQNLNLSNCFASDRAGAAYLVGTTATFAQIIDCRFEENICDMSAGALRVEVPVTITGCTFADNIAGSAPGALHLAGSGIFEVSNCTFTFNEGGVGPGGAILVQLASFSDISTISDCVFRRNTGALAGAVGYVGAGDHTLRSCQFLSNDSSSGAGAVNFDTAAASDQLRIENCLFTGNSSVNGAGAVIDSSPGVLRIVNSTVAGNTSDALIGGGVAAADGDTFIDNSIIYDNPPRSLFNNAIGTLTVNRSIVQHLAGVSPAPAGVGAIDSDPMFVDLDGPNNLLGDLDDNARLMPGSPAIDAGSDLALSPFVSLDIYGANRFADDTGTPDSGISDGVNPVVDMGAAEFQGTTPGGACNDADLAEPFGTLDFSDVFAFLVAFGASEPAADLAAPFGIFDFSDVLAFLNAFGAGCP